MRFLRKHADWTVYDPRLGDDRRFELRPGESKSALSENCWIVEGPNIDWNVIANMLDESFGAAAPYPFVLYLPWGPDLHFQKVTFQEVFEPIELDITGLLLGRSETSVDLTSRALGLRRSLGCGHSGLWSMGSVKSLPALAERIASAGVAADSSVFAVAAAMETLGCALCLDDGIDMLMLKLDDRTDGVAEEISATMERVLRVTLTRE